MRDSSQAHRHLVKPCDICGDVGFPETISTCFECKISREHVYCMRPNRLSVPKIWYCEDCRSRKGIASPKSLTKKYVDHAFEIVHSNNEAPSRLLQDSVTDKKKTTIQTSNVKFIYTEEGIRLPSGAQKSEYFSSSNLDSRYGWPPTVQLIPKETEIGSRPAHSNLAGYGSMQLFSSTTQQQVAELLEKAPKDADVNPEGLNIQGSAQKIISKLEKCFPYYLSPLSIWCGSFEILDADSHSKAYDGFRAHFPAKVHRKAFECSKQMPGVIPCRLLPCSDIWLEVFQNDNPNASDIALYFFPRNFERSKQQYIQLLRLMEMQDLALQSCFTGVQLLICSSKMLSLDSQGLGLESFLWGTYCPVGNIRRKLINARLALQN